MENENKKNDAEYQKLLKEAAEKIIRGDFSIREYYGITDGGLEAIYMVGNEMYRLKQYDKARGVFGLLTTLEPLLPKYLAACGSANFMCKDYATAAQYFRMAMMRGDYTPKSLLRLTECVIRVNQLDVARRYIDELLKLAKSDKFKDDEESQMYASRAKMIAESIEKKFKQEKKAE
ncbi:MAG: tetratricopeptide repeat protein [Puniceicoccales bacterium]|jgi:predicted Zn-dependent protease|nr:tetratricopeptide repeat protein [Puniceicoccales bacterium]